MDKLKSLNLDSPEIKSLTLQVERDMLIKIAEILSKALFLLDSYSVSAPSLGLDIPAFLLPQGLFCYMPKVILYGDTRKAMLEYCPFKKESVSIVRSTSIVVGFTNARGERVVRDLDDIQARYFQHELDSLLGIDFRTRATNAARIKAIKRKLH